MLSELSFTHYRRRSSLKLSQDDGRSFCLPPPGIGQSEPRYVSLEGVAKCMRCSAHFSMVRRKHHCRACGYVICGKCGSYKASLEWLAVGIFASFERHLQGNA